MAHEFAVRLASIGFATATLQGAINGAGFQSTLQIALVVLAAFYGLGFLCGEIARRIVEESVAAGIEAAERNGIPEKSVR